jgi:hypothetical protein
MRLKIFLGLCIIVPIGFASKFYNGPAAGWFNNSLGGVFYEIFWCLVGIFLFPKAKPFWVAFWVFAVTCFLETLQLWHPPVLEAIRSTFIGQTLIGTTFSGWDFFYYLIGCGVGWIWMRRLVHFSIASGGFPC